jgi:hypothetical protein
MIMRKLSARILLITCSALSFTAQAGTATGTWVGKTKLPNGREAPFVVRLTQQGNKVSGTLVGTNGFRNVTISQGKNDNDTITFAAVGVVNGNSAKFNYVGKLNGNALDLVITPASGGGNPVKIHTERAPK